LSPALGVRAPGVFFCPNRAYNLRTMADNPLDDPEVDAILATVKPRPLGLALPQGVDYDDINALRKAVALDPSSRVYPPMLAVEVALFVIPKTKSIAQVLSDYNLSAEDWKAMCQDPLFVNDV